jgi:hypothetical protein
MYHYTTNEKRYEYLVCNSTARQQVSLYFNEHFVMYSMLIFTQCSCSSGMMCVTKSDKCCYNTVGGLEEYDPITQ